MKRLGAIIAAAIMLTIGGVYAAFAYSQDPATSASANIGLGIEGKTTATAKGTITLDSLGITVTNAGNYTTGMSTTKANVTFTPATGADEGVKTDGIKLKLTVTITERETGANSYNGTTIFTVKGGAGAGVELNGGAATKVVEIDPADYIGIAAIPLPTASDYDAFAAKLAKITITFAVSEAV